jgi:hypothetical protein
MPVTTEGDERDDEVSAAITAIMQGQPSDENRLISCFGLWTEPGPAATFQQTGRDFALDTFGYNFTYSLMPLQQTLSLAVLHLESKANGKTAADMNTVLDLVKKLANDRNVEIMANHILS